MVFFYVWVKRFSKNKIVIHLYKNEEFFNKTDIWSIKMSIYSKVSFFRYTKNIYYLRVFPKIKSLHEKYTLKFYLSMCQQCKTPKRIKSLKL